MKRSTKRLVGLLIALCLIVGLLPAAALAVDGGTNDPEAPTGTLVITKTFTFVDDDEEQPNPIAPDPTLLESFEMTVTEEMRQKGETAEAADVPTVTYDAEEGNFVASDGQITQLTEGVGYVWTLERTPGNYLIEESGIFGYRFLGNEWTVDEKVAAEDSLYCNVPVSADGTQVAVTNSYQRRYGDIVLSKIIRGITYEDFLKTGATFTLEGPPDFNGGEPMTFAFNSDFSNDYVTQDEIREAHHGIEGYNLLEPVEHVPFGVYTVTEEHADFKPYHLTVSYGDGGYNDYIYILKKAAGPAINDEKAAGEWDEFGYPPYHENQFVVGTLYEYDENLTSGRIVIDTYTAEGNIIITKVFDGLEGDEFPDEFGMGLLPAEWIENGFPKDPEDNEEPPFVEYSEKTGSFYCSEGNVRTTQNGFVWTLPGFRTGTYYLAEFPGFATGSRWSGIDVTGLKDYDQPLSAQQQDVELVLGAKLVLKPRENKVLTVTNHYEPAYGYITITKTLADDSAEDAAIPDETTFTVRDEDGNVAAELTYAELQENNLVQLPAGAYYVVEETNAEVEGYVVTAKVAVAYPSDDRSTPDLRAEAKAAAPESDDHGGTIIASTVQYDLYVDEYFNETRPIEVLFTNKYTPESECGTLTITKIVDGLPDDIFENDAYAVRFQIAPQDGSGSPLTVVADSFTKKTDGNKAYYESAPVEIKLPNGTYDISELDAAIDYYNCYGYGLIDGNTQYRPEITISDPTDVKELTYVNEYWPREDGTLSIFTQINGVEPERLRRDFGFEITGPEGFGENGKKTVLFSDMVPVTEDFYYWDRFLEQGDWYVYTLLPYPHVEKSRSYESDGGPGYEYGPMPAGEYTIREINADVSEYHRTTESFQGYFTRFIVVKNVLETQAQAPRAQGDNPMIVEIELSKDYDTEEGYAAFINNYEKGGIGGGDDPEPPPTLNTEEHFDYIQGYPDGLVRPEGNITRAEVATIFFRLLKDEVREEYLAETNDFSDVDEGLWYSKAISTLANMGILRGYTDGTFKPNGMITRAEFATIAAAFDDRADVPDADFIDLSDHWAALEVSIAAANGWVNGYPDGTFGPDSLITRAEAMAIVNRVLNRCPASTDDLLDGMITWPDNADTSKWYYLDVQEATNSHEYTRAGERETWTKLLPKRDWLEIEQSQTA